MVENEWRQRFEEEIAPLDEAAISDGRLSAAVFTLVDRRNPSDRDQWAAMARNPSVSESSALAGVLGVTTIDRRNRDFGKFIGFIRDDSVNGRLGRVPAFQMLRAEALMYDTQGGREECLERARGICARHLPSLDLHDGAQNLMVEICLQILELSARDREDVLQQAEVASERSLEITDHRHAKYLAHRGVLRAYRGRRLEALADVRRAMELEDSGRWDYAARLSQYEGMAARIETICLGRNLAQQVESARLEIEGARGQVLTMTGLLAAVVAIVIVNVDNIRGTGPRAEVLSATLAANGSVVLGFGLLISLVLTPRTRASWIMAAVVPAVGLGLLLFGVRVATWL